MNPDVNFYFSKAGQWQQEFKKLRTIILSPLAEGKGKRAE